MAQSAGSSAPASAKNFAESNGDALIRLDCLRIACRYLEARMTGGEKASESIYPIAVAETFVDYVMHGGKRDVDNPKK